jgi:thiamine pyrophosphokinase
MAQILSTDTIICADSGYHHAVKMGFIPAIVIGDFDSAGDIPANIPCLSFSAQKDQTDTELAIEYAWDKGFRDFLLLGGFGNRIDHSLTNLLQLMRIHARGGTAILINENNKVMLTTSSLHLQEPHGTIVSLLPLSNCHGVTTKNLEYPLANATLTVGEGRGISNIMASDDASVSIHEGTLLVIVAKD